MAKAYRRPTGCFGAQGNEEFATCGGAFESRRGLLTPSNGADDGPLSLEWDSHQLKKAMKYSVIPKELSSIQTLRIAKHPVDDSDDEDGFDDGCSRGVGVIPLCTRGVSPTFSTYTKVGSSPHKNSPQNNGFNSTMTKAFYSYGTLPRNQASIKSCSLPPTCRTRTDSIIVDVLKIPPEEMAAQITLRDLPVFKSITPEELMSCGWTKKDKGKLTPNVVEFTRRFNHVSFWVVREILSHTTVKSRAERISYFIRTAKKLNELNNFHSQFAIISALQSAPIYRLNKTWYHLHKKDRQSYERMAELFSDQNNWEHLRSHVNTLKLPMIPYLGLFLTDLVFIDMAHPHYGGLESEQRQLKMNNILRVISDYQLSTYPNLERNYAVQSYLSSVRYIEELQKFVEDDHFKLSLQLEPHTPVSPSQKGSPIGCFKGSSNVSPVHRNEGPNLLCPAHGGPHQQQTKFVPGHRKSRSLGTNIFKGNPFSGDNSRSDSLSSLGGLHDPTCPSARGNSGSKHLIDDSEIDPNPGANSHDCNLAWSEMSSDSDDVALELTNSECGIQGPIRRKALIKDGRKLKVASWHRYWIQLWGDTLVYYRPRSVAVRGLERGDYKTAPCKFQTLVHPGGKLKIMEYLGSPDTFQLSDPSCTCVYKFRAPSVPAAESWIKCLRQSLEDTPVHTPENLISFD